MATAIAATTTTTVTAAATTTTTTAMGRQKSINWQHWQQLQLISLCFASRVVASSTPSADLQPLATIFPSLSLSPLSLPLTLSLSRPLRSP